MLTLPRKLWALLTTRERWQLAGLSGMIVLMGLAQVVGVGSIAPFVSVLVNPESVHTNEWLRWAFESFGFKGIDSFLVFLALAVLVAVALANGFLALTQWALIRFGWALQYRLSRRLMEVYLAQPYVTFLGRNSADTGKNVLSEVERLTDGVVLPLMSMMAFAVAVLFLLAVLFWANAVLTFAVITVLGGGYGVAYLAVRRTLARGGERRIHANTERYKAVNEAFGGIKEAKVLGREAALLGQYDGPARRFANVMATEQVVALVPRYALEVLAVGVILLMALFLIGTADGAIQGVAPLLAMYVFAAQRLLPFLAQVYRNSGHLRFNGVVVDTIYDDMAGKSRPRPPASDAAPTGARLPFRHELRLEGVTFSYPRAERPAVQDVTVSIPHRAFVAIVGATGAGKTTLVDIILGLLQPDEGILTVDGAILDETVLRIWQNNLGYVPQDIYLADDSIAANIAFGIPPQDRRREAIEKAARVANIHDFIVDELPRGYDTVVGERGVRLSGGERQRIGIARALYHDPEVLVLDEATSNLDQRTEGAVHKAIEQAAAAKTVIMIAHRLSTTRQCDALYLLDHGRLVAQGSYETLLLSSDRFRAMAGTR
jgi:ABC-type multidrug transport system fused ATPase/permease subunit